MGEEAVLQAGEELQQVASSGEAEWRSLYPVLTDQHHRPPTVNCSKCSLGLIRQADILFDSFVVL